MAGLPLLSSKLTLLEIIQDVCNEIGITAPTQVVNNTDPQIQQLLALANREGKEFYSFGKRIGGWQALRKEHVFPINAASGLTGTFTSGSNQITNIIPNTSQITASMQIYVTTYLPIGTTVLSVDDGSTITVSATVSGSGGMPGSTTYLIDNDGNFLTDNNGNLLVLDDTSGGGTPPTTYISSFFCGQTDYSAPDDFDHYITQTFWDRNFRWQLLGPLDPQEWQVLKSGISPTGPRRRFRVYNNLFCIDPVPGFSSSDNGSLLVYEYYSRAWCQSEGGVAGTPQTSFEKDTDNYVLDDDCMILGIIWRFLRAKRLSNDIEFQTYQNATQRVMSRDGANRNLPMNASASGIRFISEYQIPDCGFGS